MFDNLVVDSGAIIRGSTKNLHLIAKRLITIREVLDEIRDEKSRFALDSLPFDFEVLAPNESSMKIVADFAKKTGDFATLSSTDLKLIALTYQLEVSINGTKNIRTSPKPLITKKGGVSKSPSTLSVAQNISSLASFPTIQNHKMGENKVELIDPEFEEAMIVSLPEDDDIKEEAIEERSPDSSSPSPTSNPIHQNQLETEEPFVNNNNNFEDGEDDEENGDDFEESGDGNPSLSSITLALDDKETFPDLCSLSFPSLPSPPSPPPPPTTTTTRGVWGSRTIQSTAPMHPPSSPILSPLLSVSTKPTPIPTPLPTPTPTPIKPLDAPIKSPTPTPTPVDTAPTTIKPKPSQPQFVSRILSNGISTYVGEVGGKGMLEERAGGGGGWINPSNISLFRGLGMEGDRSVVAGVGGAVAMQSPKAPTPTRREKVPPTSSLPSSSNTLIMNSVETNMPEADGDRRDGDSDDDGVPATDTDGVVIINNDFITIHHDNKKKSASVPSSSSSPSPSPSSTMCSFFAKGKCKNGENCRFSHSSHPAPPPVPAPSSPCMTTDFAMQNVLMQMGLGIVSVDGLLIKSVKSFVLRCIGCYQIHTEMSRLFCSRCGLSHLTRVSVSLNSSNGSNESDEGGSGASLTLHLKKDYRIETKGMQYSLPKPGSQPRFQGELLLREDQLMSGIWRQKTVKIKKNVTSAFGEDVTSDVGLHINKGNVIQIGLGKQNPNARKGRERRGQKKH